MDFPLTEAGRKQNNIFSAMDGRWHVSMLMGQSSRGRGNGAVKNTGLL